MFSAWGEWWISTRRQNCVETRLSTRLVPNGGILSEPVLPHPAPPSSTGGIASEYVLQVVANGRCYSIYLLFISVPVETATTVVQGVVTSFHFAK
jgi:hypothetical protein